MSSGKLRRAATTNTPPPEAKVFAGGGVVWRPGGGSGAGPDRRSEDLEVAIAHRPKYDDWSLPKGKVDPGEQLIVTARREVEEETGFATVSRQVLGEQAYDVAAGRKHVRYWVMADPHGSFTPSGEVDVLEWLSPEKAVRRLSYAHDRKLVETFSSLPLDTVTVLLVRHATAGDKEAWPGDDLLRPLDEVGRRQAEWVRDVSACYGPARCLSADPVRCLQTLQPLTAVIGEPLEVEPLLGQEAYAENPNQTLRRVHDLIRERQPLVLCSQREVIPDLIQRLAHGGDVQLDKVGARKGSVWALSFQLPVEESGAIPRLVAADYTPDLIPLQPVD